MGQARLEDSIIRTFRNARQLLAEPVDSFNLSLFRICFAAVLIGYLLVYRSPDVLELFYLSSDFHFSFSLFHMLHLPAPSAGLLATLHAALLAAAGCLLIGMGTRAAAGVSLVGFGYLLLLEKAVYAHHDYLILLFCFLFVVAGGGRRLSVDALLFGRGKSTTVPRWTLFLFQYQVSIVYFFSAMNRMNTEWLSGRVSDVLFEGAGIAFILASVIIVLIVELCLSFMLIISVFRPLGLVLLVLLNLAVKYYLDMTILPFLMISTGALFVDQRWMAFLPGPWKTSGDAGATPDRAGGVVPTPQWIFIGAYLLLQVLIPMRHFIVPGAVQWNMLGERFSWRLYAQLSVGHVDYFVTDIITGETEEVPRLKGINSGSYLIMASRPDMILQYADYIRDGYAARGVYAPLVTVNSFVSVNGRPFSIFINPDVNVAHDDVRPGSDILINPTGLRVASTRILPRSVGQFFSAPYQLAVIDSEELLPGDHPLIQEMDAKIKRLVDEEIISPYQISNLIVEMQRILHVDYGRTYTAEELLDGLLEKYGRMTTVPEVEKAASQFINLPAP